MSQQLNKYIPIYSVYTGSNPHFESTNTDLIRDGSFMQGEELIFKSYKVLQYYCQHHIAITYSIIFSLLSNRCWTLEPISVKGRNQG